MKHFIPRTCMALAMSAIVFGQTRTVEADDWAMTITVDNQYSIYFGDSTLSIPTFVGGDNVWTNTEAWSVTGVAPTAFLYVATASDHGAYQGFLGEFTNVTTATTFLTSDNTGTPWEVFPAGAHLPALNGIDASIPAGVWPFSTQPTVSQVQTAVQYATANGLWQTPNSFPGWDNIPAPSPPIWGNFPAINSAAEWIWHDSGSGPAPRPFRGFNHNEFLVFRIAGQPIPEPASWALLVGMFLTIAALHRRFSNQQTH